MTFVLSGTELECHCYACNDKPELGLANPVISTMFILCTMCGNKRCPHAAHHDSACTGSNEPGHAPGAGDMCECGHDRTHHSSRGSQCSYGGGSDMIKRYGLACSCIGFTHTGWPKDVEAWSFLEEDGFIHSHTVIISSSDSEASILNELGLYPGVVNVKKVWETTARSWADAMIAWHKHMDFEPYQPPEANDD